MNELNEWIHNNDNDNDDDTLREYAMGTYEQQQIPAYTALTQMEMYGQSDNLFRVWCQLHQCVREEDEGKGKEFFL